MTDWQRPGDRYSPVDAPTEDTGQSTPQSEGSTTIERSTPGVELVDETNDEPRSPRKRPANGILLLSGVLVLLVAQVVFSFFLFTTSTQVRDQAALANGLQRCLIKAQLDASTTTDPTGANYKTAVLSCLSK